MATVKFWEKPGCRGNARQKQILVASGHTLEVHNLLTETWTPELLRSFFGEKPVAEWFNPSHPQVKSGAVIPATLSAEAALTLMLSDPLFIVRPLLQVGDTRQAGFDVPRVHQWIGLATSALGGQDPKNCPCVPAQS